MSRYQADAHSETADPAPSSASDEVWLTRNFVSTTAAVGAIAAGVALIEVALIPGMVIGAAAVLAPKYLPKLGPSLLPLLNLSRRTRPALSRPGPSNIEASLTEPVRPTIKHAIAKTITYRIIVTTLDFSVNYLVLGELATAAGLSAFALTVGPLFYLAHETAWNYLGASDKRVDVTVLLPVRRDATPTLAARRGVTISRALAKTITFRTIATTMDFTANFVVVGDLATAAALSASGFVLGPFVYLGHEMAWDRFGSRQRNPRELPSPTRLLPAPG